MNKMVKNVGKRTKSSSKPKAKKRSIKKMNNLDEILIECAAKIRVVGRRFRK